MSKDLNQVFLIGRLTKQTEIRYTPSGTPVCNFSIANNQGTKEKPEVNFFEVVVWGNMANVCSQYLSKGSQVAISGRLQQQRWTDKTSGQTKSKIIIVAENVQFIGGKKEKEEYNPFNEKSE